MENREDATIEMNQVIRQAESLMQTTARRAKIEIRLNLGEGLALLPSATDLACNRCS